MTPLLVFSPHLDDGVLSVGHVLAGAPGAAVVTLLAGAPDDGGQLTPFDARSGFATAADAIRVRRVEDVDACTVLGVRPVHLRYVDGQYGQRVERADLVRSMRRAIVETRARIAAGPVGVMHPDHELVGDAWFDAVAGLSESVQCWVYEELPGRVLDPDGTHDRLDKWRASWPLVMGVPATPTDDVERKALAVRRYTSQLWALDPVWHPCMCPERLWQVIR